MTTYAEQLLQTLEHTHEFARKRLEVVSDKMKSYYDGRPNDTSRLGMPYGCTFHKGNMPQPE
ncbi:MAG: hypothetical protein MJE68_32705 [Proteobacteria bacterium]|nr:hypothetical protein [Pseudomonadota bacterium]